MKNFTKLAVLVALVAFVASSCGKYEEGPSISLSSKKSRVVNIWKLDAEYLNGVEQTLTDDDKNTKMEFTKDDKMTITTVMLGATVTFSGTWSFDDTKESIITEIDFAGSISKDTSKILKLKSKELWLENTTGTDKTEFHYVSE